MPNSRWPKHVLTWDQARETGAWFSEIKCILNYAGLQENVAVENTVGLDLVKDNLLKICRNKRALATIVKRKL